MTTHHHAASTATLTAVGVARRDLAQRREFAEQYGLRNPTAKDTPDPHRLAALSTALGHIGHALATACPYGCPEPTPLHTALSVLAAVALGWLDTLPTPHRPRTPNDTTDHDDDTGQDYDTDDSYHTDYNTDDGYDTDTASPF